MLFQRSFYIDLPASDCNFIIKYNGKNRMESDIYFIDAFQQRAKAKNLDKLSLAFIKCIPKLKCYKLGHQKIIVLSILMTKITQIHLLT